MAESPVSGPLPAPCLALSCQWPLKPCMLDDYPAIEVDEMPPWWAVKDCATLD